MMARGQGSGAMVVAGVTPRSASARSRRHRAGTPISMALRREPPTGCTCTPSGTSSSTPERTTRCSSSSRPSPIHPLSRFSVTTPRLVPRAGTALTTTRTGSTVYEAGPQASGVSAVLHYVQQAGASPNVQLV